MRDLKYIVKRIFIGVGIVLVLGFINSARASALEITGYTGLVNKSDVTSSSVNRLLLKKYSILFYQDTYSGDIIICNNDTKCNIIYVSQIPFNYNKIGIATWNTRPSSSATHSHFVFLTDNSDLPYINGNTSFSSMTTRSNTLLIQKSTTFSSMSNTARLFTFGSNENFTFPGINFVSFSDYYFDSNTAWVYNCYNNVCKNSNSDIVIESISSAPTIESWQPTKITNNNVITGYIFRPKFSNFDTSLYQYQYKIGKDSTTWLNLNSNEQQIRVNNNVEIYIRVKEISSGDIIDSANFTITNIGTFNTIQDYNIIFSGEYRTENYLNNNISSKSQSIINEYQIYVDYIPKSSILKYQYQYVFIDSSLDNNNWQNVSSSDNGSITYVATENGTLYARILDNEDNILYTSTFTVNSIGLIAFDSNLSGVDNFLTKLRDKINYGGPVSSLFVIPIFLLDSLYSPILNSNTCSNLNLGSLLGTNLYLPCVDIPRYLGNSFYTIIDLIFSFFLLLGIFKMSIRIYNKFISMKDIHS